MNAVASNSLVAWKDVDWDVVAVCWVLLMQKLLSLLGVVQFCVDDVALGAVILGAIAGFYASM